MLLPVDYASKQHQGHVLPMLHMFANLASVLTECRNCLMSSYVTILCFCVCSGCISVTINVHCAEVLPSAGAWLASLLAMVMQLLAVCCIDCASSFIFLALWYVMLCLYRAVTVPQAVQAAKHLRNTHCVDPHRYPMQPSHFTVIGFSFSATTAYCCT